MLGSHLTIIWWLECINNRWYDDGVPYIMYDDTYYKTKRDG